MAVVKVLFAAAFVVLLLYLSYRFTEWYFELKRAALEQEQREQDRVDAIWADGDPETIEEEYLK